MKPSALVVLLLGLTSNTAWAKSVEDLPNTQVYDSCSEGPRVWHVICKASEGHHKRSALEEKLLDELFQYFGYVASAYTHVLEDLPMDSPQQKAMIAEQKAYLDGMDDCGNDLKCILRAEKRRLDELNALRRKLEKPLPDAEMQRLTK
ncbi:hypothetical protein HFU84_06720, partial [Acidithiobacillus sp. CV18-2]|nr:hypothetical protein [Acidithiobacillus sp. CV18-2]